MLLFWVILLQSSSFVFTTVPFPFPPWTLKRSWALFSEVSWTKQYWIYIATEEKNIKYNLPVRGSQNFIVHHRFHLNVCPWPITSPHSSSWLCWEGSLETLSRMWYLSPIFWDFPRFILVSSNLFVSLPYLHKWPGFLQFCVFWTVCCSLSCQGMQVALSKVPRHIEEPGPIPFIYNYEKAINKTNKSLVLGFCSGIVKYS